MPRNFLTTFLIGGLSGTISKTITAPLERCKMLLQLQDVAKDGQLQKKYTGIIDIITRVPKEEGFFALWRGNWTNILRYFPTSAFNFAFKEKYKKFFNVYD